MQKFQDYVLDAAGNAISGATVAVTLNGGGAATIYSDNGVTAIVGNLSTDATGQFEFYAANGRYDLTISGTGVVTENVTDIILFDQADGHIDDIAGLARTDGNIIVGDGTDWVAESGATARTSLGLAIGTNVQAYDAALDDISALAVTDGNIIVGDGANWVAESGATARTSLGVNNTTDVAEIANLTHASNQVVQSSGSAWTLGYYMAPMLHFEDQKSAGTDGGGFTSGAWRTRDIAAITNSITGASISANQIILPAGTYIIEWSAPARRVDRHVSRLYNVDDTSETIHGTNEFSNSTDGDNSKSVGFGQFTIAAQKTFEIQHQCQTTKASDGFGLSINGSFTVASENFTTGKIYQVG